MQKIALIGCGRISGKHLESIAQLPNDLTLTAVCDIQAERARAAGEKYHVDWYSDYEKLLEKEALDLVAICTPSGLHPQHGIAAARKGLHVIVEKPMAITLESADQLIHACDQAKVELFVVKQNRLNTTLQLLKRAVDKGRFGKIYMVQSNVFWQRPQSYYDLAKWRGSFMNQASHYVDAV